MNKKILTLLGAVACCALLTPLSAQKSKKGGFAAIDSNGDGSLTLAEYTNAVIKRENVRWQKDGLTPEQIKDAKEQVSKMSKDSFAALDMNGDGKVPESEIVAYHKSKNPAPAKAVSYEFPTNTPGFMRKRFKDHDVNKDGFLTLEEFTTYLGVWLKETQPDTNPVTFAPGPFRNKDTNGDGKLSTDEALSQYK